MNPSGLLFPCPIISLIALRLPEPPPLVKVVLFFIPKYWYSRVVISVDPDLKRRIPISPLGLNSLIFILY